MSSDDNRHIMINTPSAVMKYSIQTAATTHELGHPPNPAHGTRIMLVISLVCLGTLGLVTPASGDTTQGPPPALVRLGKVKQQMVQARWDVVGRLREVRRAIVAAEQPGRVIEASIEEGQPVIAGQTVLARIDDIWVKLSLESTTAELAQARAGVDEAVADLDQATRDREYLEGLRLAGSAKPKEAADARSTQQAQQARLARAKADVLSAQAQLQRCHEQLKRLTVLAPFDGVIVDKVTEVGQWVNQGDAVAEILSRGQIDAVVDIPERLINQVEAGLEIEMMIDHLSLDVSGRVIAVNPQASTAARTFPVKIRLDDQQGTLKSGMSVTARIPTGRRVDALTVPRDAIHRSTMGLVVWAQIHGQAVPVPVNVLFGHQNRYVVKITEGGPGLADGTPVVIEGAERLFPGQPLLATDPVAAAPTQRGPQSDQKSKNTPDE